MNKGVLLRLILCVSVFALYLYQIIQKQNTLNYVSLKIPKLAKEVKSLEEENLKLQFEIEKFESPENLMRLVRSEQFTHLKIPILKEVLSLKEGIALNIDEDPLQDVAKPRRVSPVLAVGTSP